MATRVNGRFASRKMGKALPWESQIEKDFIVLSELDPTIAAIHPQPLRVEYRLNGERHTYVPDFALVTTEQIEIHEVKPDDKVTELTAIFAAVAPVFADQGMVFCIARESAIRVEPRLGNAWMLWRGLHVSVPTHIIEQSHSMVADRPGIRVRELGIPEYLVLALIAQGNLRTNCAIRLNGDSSLWLAGDFPHCERIVPFEPVRWP